MNYNFSTLPLPLASKRVRAWHDEATPAEIREGLRWYSEAMDYAKYLSDYFGTYTTVVCAGVISALSPNNNWERNKIDAFNLLQAHADGLTPDQVKVCTYNPNKLRAWGIASGDVQMLRKARKTHAFALNVGMMDDSVVTIDKWMLRAFLTTSKQPKELPTSCTPAQYDRLSAHFCKLAKRMGYKPYELQAIIWVVIRNRWMS